MDNGGMELDIIVNPKVTEDGHSVIQVCFLFLVLCTLQFDPFLC